MDLGRVRAPKETLEALGLPVPPSAHDPKEIHEALDKAETHEERMAAMAKFGLDQPGVMMHQMLTEMFGQEKMQMMLDGTAPPEIMEIFNGLKGSLDQVDAAGGFMEHNNILDECDNVLNNDAGIKTKKDMLKAIAHAGLTGRDAAIMMLWCASAMMRNAKQSLDDLKVLSDIVFDCSWTELDEIEAEDQKAKPVEGELMPRGNFHNINEWEMKPSPKEVK